MNEGQAMRFRLSELLEHNQKTMKLTSVHIADYAMISREGKVSIVGIFSEINAVSAPTVHPQFFVVFLLVIEEGDFGRNGIPMSLTIVDPEGNELLGRTGELNVPERRNFKSVAFTFRVDMLELPSFGPYEVRAAVDGHQKTVSLTVSKT